MRRDQPVARRDRADVEVEPVAVGLGVQPGRKPVAVEHRQLQPDHRPPGANVGFAEQAAGPRRPG